MKAKDLIKNLMDDFDERYNKALNDYKEAKKTYGEQHPWTCEKAGYFFAISNARTALLVGAIDLEKE